MPVREMSETIIVDLAHRYGIEVRWVDYVRGKFEGPAGHGCDPKKRVLYFLDAKMNEYGGEIEHYFHELVHVIVQPPWRGWSISATPEEFVLFQFERALADATLEDWAYERVADWQENTYTLIRDTNLGSIPDYERSRFWKLGYNICRKIDVLDSENRPTYKLPDWSSITPHRRELGQYYRSLGINPVPSLG